MIDLTTDIDLDLVMLPIVVIMLLIGRIVQQLFAWLDPDTQAQSGTMAA